MTSQRQAYLLQHQKWIADNNIQVGSQVIVLRAFTFTEHSCNIGWNPTMTQYIGEICTVQDVTSTLTIGAIRIVKSLNNHSYGWWWPYFALAPIAEDEGIYK